MSDDMEEAYERAIKRTIQREKMKKMEEENQETVYRKKWASVKIRKSDRVITAMLCPNCGSHEMLIEEREKGIHDVICGNCGYTVWGELEAEIHGYCVLDKTFNTIMSKGFFLIDAEGTLDEARQHIESMPPKRRADMVICRLVEVE